MPHRRALGIALGLFAAVILFASTSVTVHVVPSAQGDEARRTAFVRPRDTRSRLSARLVVAGFVLLIPATWLVVRSGRSDSGSTRG